MSKLKDRRITITRDPTTGRLTAARDADSGKSVPVDPLLGAIKIGRRWYTLRTNAKDVLIPRDTL